MSDVICSISDCPKPVKRRGFCYGHYMKWWRYGDPKWLAPSRKRDLTGLKFGLVVVLNEMPDGHWKCRCDCGRETRVRGWSLTSGGTTTCGHGPTHWRSEGVGYSAAHDRVRRDKGAASRCACVDCGDPAAHWSYDHGDDRERVDEEGYAYSLDSEHYVPRCVPCHKRFDLGRADAATAGVADG